MTTSELPTIASLCAGYGGLERGVAEAIGGANLTWYSEIEPAACQLLEHHHPGTLNIGDLTVADFGRLLALGVVDILTGGYPCQPFSLLGKRAGTDDERHLWPHIATAIRILRPRMFVGENVRGHLSLGFDQVLADLDELGYDVRWVVAKASDLVLACHSRARLFFVATDRHQDGRVPRPAGGPIACHVEGGWHGPNDGLFGPVPFAGSIPTAGVMVAGDMYEVEPPPTTPWSAPLLPTPRTSDTTGPGLHGNGGMDLRTAVSLLPTPTAADGDRASLSMIRGNPTLLGAVAQSSGWGIYEPAVRRWEQVSGRPAPAPTMTSPRGGEQLAPALPEWMMGLPEGHITAVPGLSRAEQIKLAGNGVMPQQCSAAVRWLLAGSAVWAGDVAA